MAIVSEGGSQDEDVEHVEHVVTSMVQEEEREEEQGFTTAKEKMEPRNVNLSTAEDETHSIVSEKEKKRASTSRGTAWTSSSSRSTSLCLYVSMCWWMCACFCQGISRNMNRLYNIMRLMHVLADGVHKAWSGMSDPSDEIQQLKCA